MRHLTLFWLIPFSLTSCTNPAPRGLKEPLVAQGAQSTEAPPPAGTVTPPPANELTPATDDGPSPTLASEDLSNSAAANKSPYGAGLEDQPQASVTPVSPAAPAETNGTEPVLPQKTPLEQATALFEASSFEEALSLLRSLPPEAPEAPEAAKLKLKIANKAVSELRTKAAKALQSALSLVDVSARDNYLQSSRKYLQKALADFPESDQLELVKKNLGMVEKELAALTSG